MEFKTWRRYRYVGDAVAGVTLGNGASYSFSPPVANGRPREYTLPADSPHIQNLVTRGLLVAIAPAYTPEPKPKAKAKALPSRQKPAATEEVDS